MVFLYFCGYLYLFFRYIGIYIYKIFNIEDVIFIYWFKMLKWVIDDYEVVC